MKKETIITAAVFLAVGFLAGYVYNSERSSTIETDSGRASAVQPPEAPASAAASSADPSSATVSGWTSYPLTEPSTAATSNALPPGHPPLDAASTVQMLEGEAAAQPANPRPRLELANFFYDQKNFEKAIPWYLKALDLDPNNVNARTDLGTANFSLGRADEAARQYRKSLEVDPNHQPTLYNLALVSIEGTRDLATARDAYARLKKLNPSYPGMDALQQALDSAGDAAGRSKTASKR